MKSNWRIEQLEYWNNRAKSGKGTGVVPFREIELAFVFCWKSGNRILDAGCGLGEVMSTIKNRDPLLSLKGFDYSFEMLKEARRNIIDVFQSDIINIPLANRCVTTSFAVRTIKNLLDLHSQEKAILELTRVTSRRVIIIDSIKESNVTPPKFNMYISRNWLFNILQKQGFTLVREEYFRKNIIDFPSIASSKNYMEGSDEGFYVFDRKGGSLFEQSKWKFYQIKYSGKSLKKILVSLPRKIFNKVSKFLDSNKK